MTQEPHHFVLTLETHITCKTWIKKNVFNETKNFIRSMSNCEIFCYLWANFSSTTNIKIICTIKLFVILMVMLEMWVYYVNYLWLFPTFNLQNIKTIQMFILIIFIFILLQGNNEQENARNGCAWIKFCQLQSPTS